MTGFGLSDRKMETILDDKDFVGVVLMELSKVFDTLNHKTLLAKLNAYSFKRDSRKLINYYLLNWCQRKNISSS